MDAKSDLDKRQAAKQFIDDWLNKGDEKQDTARFWLQLLRQVYNVDQPENYVRFEHPVRLQNGNIGYIDAWIPDAQILIEQKSQKINLRAGERQSDGEILTPFQQGRRYGAALPHRQNPHWIITCNFQTFEIHDMNRPNDEPEVVELKNLAKEFYRLDFLVTQENIHLKKEMEISVQAGDIVGKIYDAFHQEYYDPDSPETAKNLNKLCVRLVFCLYAEDAGLFGRKNMFHDYLAKFPVDQMRQAVINLFNVLATKPADRDHYLADDLAAFPYINGGLFAGAIEIPNFTDQIRELLLSQASDDFDWSDISPTIFGAVFESTLNPETRRSGGMHYTSVENIHKVIDPLFLNELKDEFAQIRQVKQLNERRSKLLAFQNKLAGLTFLDPACGSGNFLTESFLSLRRLENEVISLIYNADGQIMLGLDNIIKVNIQQFYGIEINDFAVSVAETALRISQAQTLRETEEIIHLPINIFPFDNYHNIVEGNALHIDWESVVSKDRLNYIMGNPPFVGGMMMSREQKADMIDIFGKNIKGIGELDYVAAWYRKATDLIVDTKIESAFVSTNSITQGEQVAILWKHLFNDGIVINFAYQTFQWDSEASIKAHVHCVIVGFSFFSRTNRQIFIGNTVVKHAHNINGYLLDAPNIALVNRSAPLCNVPPMNFGNMPRDGGGFILTEEQKTELEAKEPIAKQWIHLFLGAAEFINSKKRYCLWLENASPADLRQCPTVLARIEQVRQMRTNSKAEATRRLADTPTTFAQITQPIGTPFLLVPRVSSEKRRYVPMGFLPGDVISSDAVQIIPNATMYHFGVLTSNVHMAWMRAVCGRLKSDYRYSKDIVYNNFPWPNATDEQKQEIAKTAQDILDARALYPDSSLADLYDENTMPRELREAHRRNDRAVMRAYGFDTKTMTESSCVAELMQMYQQLV